MRENSVTLSNRSLCASAPCRESKNDWFAERRKGAKRLLLATALALVPSAAVAQAGDDKDEVFYAPVKTIIVTATGAEQNPAKTGQAITILDEGALDRNQLPTVSDLLSRTPGITVSRNGGIGSFSAVRIRGAEGEQTLTLIDGVRVNDPSSPGGGFDFGNLLVGNIERIEILRGPNSVPWGSQALGGVVNIMTAVPQFFANTKASARIEYGYRESAQLVGNAQGSLGSFSGSIAGGYFHDNGISSFKDGTERDGYRQYAGNIRLGARLSENADLDFRAYYANSRTKIDGFPPPFYAFADTPEFSKTEQLFAYAGANIRLFNDALKNRIAFTINDTNRDNFDAPGQATPSFFARGRIERFEYQGDAAISNAIRAVFGAEHEKSRFSDGFSPVQTSASSGYAQLVIDPTGSLTITGGARVDDYKSYGTKATFSTNLAWRPLKGTIIRAAYGEGFKAPTLFQLFSFYGNRTLNPETAKSYEIGIEQSLIERTLTIGATIFQRNTRNQIDFVSCFGQTTGICTNRPFGTYDNVKRARAKGLEAFVRMTPSETLTIDANYSLIDAKDRDTGLTLLRRPKHSVNASVDWVARDWLRLGASIQTVSDSFDSDFQTFTRSSLDGYTLVGLRAAVPINDMLEFYGRVENVFDTSYQTVSGYGTYGRNAHIGVRAKF
jgi:vitamin B12 transporter